MKLKIISDGTRTGTKLIDSDTGEMVHGVSLLAVEANADDAILKVTVEFSNIPVEITTKATVDLFELKAPDYEVAEYSKSFTKDIKFVAEAKDGKTVITTNAKVLDVESGKQVNAIQSVKWEATPTGAVAKVKRLKFDNTDW